MAKSQEELKKLYEEYMAWIRHDTDGKGPETKWDEQMYCHRTEQMFYLMSELICMPMRDVAQMVELDIWRDSAVPRLDRLVHYINLLVDSVNGIEFMLACKNEVDNNGLGYRVANVDGGVRVSRKD